MEPTHLVQENDMANADDKFRSELDAFLNKTVGHVVFDDWAVVETLMRAAVGWGFTFKYDADKLKGLVDKFLGEIELA